MRALWITNYPFIALLQIRTSDDLFIIIIIIINDIFDAQRDGLILITYNLDLY